MKTKLVDFSNPMPRVYTNPDLDAFKSQLDSGLAVLNPDMSELRGVPLEQWILKDGKIVKGEASAEKSLSRPRAKQKEPERVQVIVMPAPEFKLSNKAKGLICIGVVIYTVLVVALAAVVSI